GIVYVPTGSASPDFYGGTRKGPNLFANSIVALDGSTGEYIWHYQVVHHDLWDRDLPANPNLVTVNNKGKEIDALAQITKQGYVFLLDRTNGEPVFPIEERPVPQNALPGEEPWPTQPYPTLPEPFSRQHFGPDEINDLNPETYGELMERYKKIKHREHFAPPSKEGGWMFPDFGGGGEWGGAAVDLETQILYVNSNEVPSSLEMIDAPHQQSKGVDQNHGLTIYGQMCMSCHGQNFKGNSDEFHSLLNLKEKYNHDQIKQSIDQGMNRMHSFEQIPANEKDQLISFLLELSSEEIAQKIAQENRKETSKNKAAESAQDIDDHIIPYVMKGYNRFV